MECKNSKDIADLYYGPLTITIKYRNLKSGTINLIIAISAVVISASALYISIQEVRIMREQQKATMFPYLTLTKFYNSEGYGIRLKNSGNGLAKINSYKIHNDSIYFKNWLDVQQKLAPDVKVDYSVINTVGNIRDEIVTQNEEVNIIFLKWTEETRKLEKHLFSLKVELCYASLLDDHWILKKKKPIAIDGACPIEWDKEFEFVE